MSMNGRHLYDDKHLFNQADELNLYFNKDFTRSRGVNRFKSAVIVNLQDRFSQTRHSKLHSCDTEGLG